MSLYSASLLLIAVILFGPVNHKVNAAPATYDQRQNGDFNVDARFDNFLVLVATSGNSNLFGNLAAQALDLNDFIGERSKSQKKPSETVVYETEDADGGREPYHVEIVHIEKEGHSKQPANVSDSKSEEKTESIALSKRADDSESSEQSSDSQASIESKKSGKKSRSVWKSEKGHGFVDGSTGEPKNNARMKHLQVENLDHPDDLSVKEEVLKPARPGISLKKQLSRKEEEDASLVSQERNELGHKYQELVLIGGGIENCGPGRYRDKLGVCQNDKNLK